MFPLNVPNALTLVRILLVPVLVVALLQTTPHGSTVAAIVFALAAIGIVGTFIVRSPGRTMLLTGLGLILGGALGNLIDRVRFGQVVDFLDFHAAGWHWPAFNLADSAITVGAVLLILEGFVHREGRARSTS